MLNRIEEQMKTLATLTGVMLMAAADAMSQENSNRPARRVVVSIPDRKLAVLENDRVVRIFEIAVGAPQSPSPTGIFQVVNHIVRLPGESTVPRRRPMTKPAATTARTPDSPARSAGR